MSNRQNIFNAGELRKSVSIVLQRNFSEVGENLHIRIDLYAHPYYNYLKNICEVL